jgi:hypothetical protein
MFEFAKRRRVWHREAPQRTRRWTETTNFPGPWFSFAAACGKFNRDNALHNRSAGHRPGAMENRSRHAEAVLGASMVEVAGFSEVS